MKTENKLTDFFAGFSAGAEIADASAREEWAAWSRQMSDSSRADVEAGGWHRGEAEGARMLAEVGADGIWV